MRKNPLVVEKPEKVRKGWGYEIQIINTDKYCSKILHFNQGGISSLHYHIDKYETWFLAKGTIKLKGINPDSAEEYEIMVHEGEMVDILRGTIHQVEAITEADIYEVSTPDNWEDNYRVMKGDSQK